MVSAVVDPSIPVALGPGELLDALRSCAAVLRDHAAALDVLGAEPDPDDVGRSDGHAGEDDLGAPGSGVVESVTPPDVDRRVGSDLASTLDGACDAVRDRPDFSSLCRDLSAGAAAAARSEPARCFAAFIRGASEVLRNVDRLDGRRLALALEAGAEHVTEADDGTHPGSLIAVMSAAADGALGAADSGGDLVEVLVSAAEVGLVELEQGPAADPDLAASGTVDPGAAGFLLVLDSLAAVVAGEPLPEPPRAAEVVVPTAHDGPRFVVRGRLTPPEADIVAAAALEEVVHPLCERLSFDGTGRQWAIDAVTAFPGAVVEAFADSGRLSELHIGLAGGDRRSD